jgi:hypothetical protein
MSIEWFVLDQSSWGLVSIEVTCCFCICCTNYHLTFFCQIPAVLNDTNVYAVCLKENDTKYLHILSKQCFSQKLRLKWIERLEANQHVFGNVECHELGEESSKCFEILRRSLNNVIYNLTGEVIDDSLSSLDSASFLVGISGLESIRFKLCKMDWAVLCTSQSLLYRSAQAGQSFIYHGTAIGAMESATAMNHFRSMVPNTGLLLFF